MMLELAFLPKKEFMLRALELAEEAWNAGEVPVGAIVVKEGRILGEGRNRREAGKNALAHAEMEAIQQACQALGTWRLTGCELYVTLEPCPMCTGAVINAHIDRVIYGADDLVVSPQENCELLLTRLRRHGASVRVIRRPSWGHHPHGLDEPEEIVSFLSE